jgi:hypothetical protein
MRSIIFSIVGIVAGLTGAAQSTILSVGSSSALTVKSGTIFSADSLVLTPSSDLTLSNNTIQKSSTALNVVPAPGINRVYLLNNQVTFTGTIQLYYQPSELNGNPESALRYTDSSVGGAWLASSSSTVNTSSHYVQQTAAARNFIGASASHQGTVLALSLVSFTGAWQNNGVDLQWVINQTQDHGEFAVERSTDGTGWTTIGTVAGQPNDGLSTYSFNDPNPPTGALLYRLVITKASGDVFYSYIVKLQQQQDNQVRLVAANRSVTIYFQGETPTAVRIVTAAGETIRIDRTSRTQYTFPGLMTGVYYLQYELNGNMSTRSFLIN